MKINNIFSVLMIFSLLFVVGCEDDPIIEKAESNLFDLGGATVAATASGNEFNLTDYLSGEENIPVNYTVTTNGEGVSNINSFISHNGGAPNDLGSLTSFPAMNSINIVDAAAACGISADDLVAGDYFTVSFDGVTTASGQFGTGAGFRIDVVEVFKSALAGVFDAVSTSTNQGAGIGWDDCDGNEWTGVVEWEREHTLPEDDGVYRVLSIAPTTEVFEDASHGAYYGCYDTDAQANLPNGDLRVTDTDGVLAIVGASQWGEVYSVSNVVVDGTVLTFNWTNDYGEGAAIQLTRQDGVAWPDNLSN